VVVNAYAWIILIAAGYITFLFAVIEVIEQARERDQ
jgi:hypothetical protein